MGRKRLRGVPPETFSAAQVEELERKAARLERELRLLRAVGRLMQIRSGVVVFLYDTQADAVKFSLPGADDWQTREAFLSCVKAWNADDSGEAEKLFGVFSAHGARSGCIEVTAGLWTAEPHPYRIVYERFEDADGISVVGFADDISDEAETREILKRDANRDSDTALYTEETFLRLANFEIAALTSGEKAIVYCVDLDGFGRFNEVHGTSAGDACLRAVASALKAEFRGVDLLARVGADEFAIFFRGFLAIDIIERRAQNLLDAVQQLQAGTGQEISCSLGIAVTGSPRDDAAILLANARSALSFLKRYGGNRYRMFEKDRH